AFGSDVDGLLADDCIFVSTDAEILRSMNIKDGYAMKKAVRAGYIICAISGGKNEGVRTRLRNLGIVDVFLGIEEKTENLESLFKQYDIKPENVAYMGDDIQDIAPMKMVGLPSCPQDAMPEVKAASKYISNKNGGKGCVRDLIEQVMKAQGKW